MDCRSVENVTVTLSVLFTVTFFSPPSAVMGPHLFIYLFLSFAVVLALPVPTNVDLGQNVGWWAGPNDYDEEAGVFE